MTKNIPAAVNQGGNPFCRAYAVAYGLQAAYGIPFDINWLIGICGGNENRVENVLDAVKQIGALPVGGYSSPTVMTFPHEWVERVKYHYLHIAERYKIAEYRQIKTAKELADAFNDGWYVVLCVGVKTHDVGADGIFRPRNGDETAFSHAMSAWCVNPDGTVRILNSWGPEWGENGQANMLMEDILGDGNRCYAYRVEGEEMRKKFESAVPVGIRVFIFTEPSTKSEHVKHNGNECYLRAVDDGVILSKRGDWCEVSVAQSADLTVTGWVKKKYVKEKGD